jgi:hypothetical protein
MKSTLSNLEIAAKFRAIAATEGEVVWSQQIVAGKRRFSLPFMSTSWLANHLERGSLLAHDPNAWVVESSDEHEWRLYIRVGEEYGEGWVHHFVSPVEVAVKSPQEYLLVSKLARSHWWQAEFVCPFCDHLCWADSYCQHLAVSRHSVKEPYRTTNLVSLLTEMREREFNCNMLNADIEGLKIKVPRTFVNGEWFRFAWWYIRTPELLDRIEQVLLDGKRATRYEIPG